MPEYHKIFQVFVVVETSDLETAGRMFSLIEKGLEDLLASQSEDAIPVASSTTRILEGWVKPQTRS